MLDSLFSDGGIWFSIPRDHRYAVLLVQIFMGGIGGDAGLDVDLDFDGDIGAGDAPGVEFGVLSAQTLSAFFMGSGWMGFAALRLLDMGMAGAVGVAIISGVFFGWMIMTVMRSMMKLQNSGNVSISDHRGPDRRRVRAGAARGQGHGPRHRRARHPPARVQRGADRRRADPVEHKCHRYGCKHNNKHSYS